MRVTSQMQNSSYANMQSSDTYKNFVKKEKEDDKVIDTKDTKDSKDIENTKLITKNVMVEKKEDTYVLSRINDENTATVLSEVQADTKLGIELSDYFKPNDNTDLTDNLYQVNQTIKSMTLVDYL